MTASTIPHRKLRLILGMINLGCGDLLDEIGCPWGQG